jgi:uncharacterized repeat protein (TIGR03803 family)
MFEMKSIASTALVAILLNLPHSVCAATFTVLHSFGSASDGANPMGSLIEADGNLFGVTTNGGSVGKGSVFKVSPISGSEKLVHSFTGGKDGGNPWSAPLALNGVLYGTAPNGGQAGNGVVYQADIQSGATTTLWDFPVASEGARPFGGLTAVGNFLYGATLEPASVYRIKIGTMKAVTIQQLSGDEGQDIYGGLSFQHGSLYGVALTGGSGGDFGGTAFSVSLASDAVRTIYNFHDAGDGGQPFTTPLLYSGAMYGTTQTGGSSGRGVVFKIDIASGTEVPLHVFGPGADGGIPFGSLCYHRGAVYGTTTIGGSVGYGTIFKVDISTGIETILYSFLTGSDGYSPYGGLVFYKGAFYGTSAYGGASGGGVVFRFVP